MNNPMTQAEYELDVIIKHTIREFRERLAVHNARYAREKIRPIHVLQIVQKFRMALIEWSMGRTDSFLQMSTLLTLNRNTIAKDVEKCKSTIR